MYLFYFYRNKLYNDGFDDQRRDLIINPPERWLDRYDIEVVLGRGSFGQVVKAIDHYTNEYVAIKIIKNSNVFYKQAQGMCSENGDFLRSYDSNDRIHMICCI